jgi:DNA-binding MarR family transcriptional regulator
MAAGLSRRTLSHVGTVNACAERQSQNDNSMQFGKLYPRMYIGVTAGLIDGLHHKRLGAAWMLFAWCCMRQTGQSTEGIVCRGAVVTYAQIAEEINCKRGSVREWMRRLIQKKYIRVERDRRGIRIFVLNPKKMRVSKVQHSGLSMSVGTGPSRVSNPQHSNQGYTPRNKDTYEKLLRNNLTKLLTNNKTALQSDFSTVESRRELQEQTQRRTLLARQKQEILAKYPPKEQPGQVVVIRKEATA